VKRSETVIDAAGDMSRVLDVVDAMHADTPEFAAALIDTMGMERTALAALRLLDVLIHMILEPAQNGATVTAEELTGYIRNRLGAVADE
jgi:hypothetical protein